MVTIGEVFAQDPKSDSADRTRIVRSWRWLSLVSPMVAVTGLMFLYVAAGCATEQRGTVGIASETGYASYYGSEFHGRRTASGDVYDENKLTAAHRTLPFGTRVRVTNLSNGKSVVVRINDRGPFRQGRIIDLSRRAARELDSIRAGVVRVRVERLGE